MHSPIVAGFLWQLGAVLGDWAKITGFLRKDRGKLPAIAYGVVAALFLAVVFYARQAHLSGSPNAYLYLEVGGSLLCFCYAANALVRFRGTHDRVALILAFGFVLSGMIDTIGYFGLTDYLHAGALAFLASRWDGWSAEHCLQFFSLPPSAWSDSCPRLANPAARRPARSLL